MAYITIFLLIFVGLISWKMQKSVCNLLTIYSFFWSAIVFLANLRLYGMYEFSNRPYVLIIIGSLGVTLGYMFVGNVKLPKLRFKGSNASGEYVYNNQFLYILILICAIFYGYELLRVLSLLRSGNSYYFIRRMYQGYEEQTFFTSSLESYFSSYIAVPIAYLLCPYILISIFKKKKNYKLLTLAIVAECLYLIVSASRFIILNLVFGAVYLFFLLKKKMSRRIKKWIKRLVLALCILIVIITILRENRVNGQTYDWGMIKSVYAYFSVSIPILDHWIYYIDSLNYQSFGLVFFRVPLSLFTLIFLHPLGIKFETLNNAIDAINITDNFIQIFPRHTYNAFASMFYYFYVDFREMGVFFGGIAWGYMCSKVYKNVVKRVDDRSLTIVLLFIQAMFKTMVRWEFYSSSFFMAVIIALFMFKKEKEI